MYVRLSIHLYIFIVNQIEHEAHDRQRRPWASPYLDTLVITGGFFLARCHTIYGDATHFFAPKNGKVLSEESHRQSPRDVV